MRTASSRRSGKAEEESILDISATTTTQPAGGWASARAAEGQATGLVRVVTRRWLGEGTMET
jgi:hypothetical protein